MGTLGPMRAPLSPFPKGSWVWEGMGQGLWGVREPMEPFCGAGLPWAGSEVLQNPGTRVLPCRYGVPGVWEDRGCPVLQQCQS